MGGAAAALRYDPSPPMDPLLKDLNEEQRRAVTHGEGPLLVVAGPGSGEADCLSGPLDL